MAIEQSLIDTLFSGFVLGSLYALMSTGLAMIWNTVKIVNWAHGALITLGAYLTWWILNTTDLAFPLSLMIAISFMFAVGAFMEVGMFHTLRRRQNWDINSIMSTLGVAFLVQNLILIYFGARLKQIPPVVAGSAYLPGGVAVFWQNLIIFGVAVLVLAASSVFLKFSRTGMAMRAVSQDIDGAMISGINVDRIYTYVVGIGAVMAGITGALLGSVYFVSPVLGNEPLFKAFVVIVFGGVGSTKGTVYASYAVGILEALVNFFISPFWALPALFVFMTIVLLVRPYGLSGVREAIA